MRQSAMIVGVAFICLAFCFGYALILGMLAYR